MATLRELIIKISANSQSFQSELARASRMGSDYYRTMEQGGRRATASTRETQRALAELNSQLASVRASAVGMVGAFAGAFATNELIHYADTWSQLNGRLRLASSSADDFATAQQSLMTISQRTGTSFEANANLYSRIAQSLRDAGYASADVASVTETVATSLKLSGASTEEASSVITQLSQALGSGVLRGEEFNAIMESGGRLAKFLADGLNTSIGGLRNMANNGELTTEKIVPLLTNVSLLRKEFESLPATVSGSAQKVQNAFMAWVGGASEATGASSALSGALDGLANNIDNVAAAGAVLAGVGVAKYFGSIATGVTDSIIKLASAKKETIALADAQLYSATQSQRKAVAAAEAARSDYALAVAEANVAKNTNASLIASQNLVRKRSEMIQANAQLVLSNRAVTLSQENLNKASSAVGLMRVGAGGLLSLIGGIPGALMLGAGAWYAMYQNQEQARQSAQEYASQIDSIREKTSKMSLPDTDTSRSKTIEALAEQNRLVSEQQEKVEALKRQIGDLYAARGKPGITSENDLNIVNAISIVTGQLTVEEEKLNNMRDKSRGIQQALEEIERRRNDLIKEQAWRQNATYQSLIMMNGQHTELNRLLSLGNQLLTSRSSLVNVPFAIPQAPVSDKDQETLLRKQQQAELAGLTGLARVRRQAEIELQNMGRTGPQNATYAADYLKAAERDYANSQNVAAAQKAQADATRDAGKAAREAAQTTEQYSRKMADLSIATEVQKVRANQGEKAAELFAASHEAGTKWTEEQRKSIEAGAVALAQWTQKADEAVRKQHEMADALKDLKDAARRYQDDAGLTATTSGMGNRQREQYRERQEVERVFDKTDKGAEAIAARQSALDALDKKYRQAKASELDWRAGVSAGLADWMDNVSNIAGTVSQGITSTMDSALDNVSAMLVGNKASWKDWGLSVLQTISKVALQMAVVNAMGGGSSGSGLFGSLLGGIAGGIAGGAAGDGNAGMAIQNYGSSFKFNAKGGVYSSADLSSYSGSVVDTPTFFAFAKGAGVMGEAGPEAIMPLTRDATGRLGVKALGSGTQGGAGVSVSIGAINFTGDKGGAQGNANAAGAVANQLTGAILDTINSQLRKPGTPLWNATQGKR
ncbi:phage tail tape measure protein [Cronobacter dublinensis]|nr:phage tail tape measure protein [Cronobacter dublinensis]